MHPIKKYSVSSLGVALLPFKLQASQQQTPGLQSCLACRERNFIFVNRIQKILERSPKGFTEVYAAHHPPPHLSLINLLSTKPRIS